YFSAYFGWSPEHQWRDSTPLRGSKLSFRQCPEIFRSGTEATYLQLQDDRAEVIDDGFRRDGCYVQRTSGLTNEIRPKANCLGDIHAVAHAAGADDDRVGTGFAYLCNGAGSRVAPTDKGPRNRGFERRLRSTSFDRRPTGAAGTSNIDDGDSGIRQTARQSAGNARADFLDCQRHRKVTSQTFD